MTIPDAGPDARTVATAAELLVGWWRRPVIAQVVAWSQIAGLDEEIGRRMGAGAEGAVSVPRLEDPNALLVEYERLFVGLGRPACPPYESYWRDDVPTESHRSLSGAWTADLRRLYDELGIVLGREQAPDHLMIELDALIHGLASPSLHATTSLLVRDHLDRWLPRMCRAVAVETRFVFYQDLAYLSIAWLRQIGRTLERATTGTPAT
jgi:TorA maturation chaperone TorD